MNPFRRRRGGRTRSVGADDGRGLDAFNVGSADESDTPDAPMHIVADIERAIRRDSQPGGPERSAAGLLHAAAKPSAKTTKGPEALPPASGWNTDIIAALRPRRAIPRAVEGDESAATIGRRELRSLIDFHVVRSRMAGEERDRRAFIRADADLLAIAAIFGRQHKPLLIAVEIALRPSIVAAALKQHHFFGGKVLALFGGVEFRPVFVELVAAVLGHEKTARGVEREAFAIAYPCREALRRREFLVRLVGVIAPGSAARLELRARLSSRRLQHAIFFLAGVGRGAEIDEKAAFGVDREGMHRMVARCRQAGHDRFGPGFRRDLAVFKRVADDAVVALREDRALVETDAGAAMASGGCRLAEAFDDVGVAVAFRILQRDQKPARRRRIVLVIDAAPGVCDIDDAVGRRDELAGVADVIGEDRRAEAARQDDPRRFAAALLTAFAAAASCADAPAG